MTDTISDAARDLIIACEVTSEAVYNRTDARPTWPGGGSGITVGIGFDCGYASPAQIRAFWGPYLPGAAVDALANVAGRTGSAARSCLPFVSKVLVPWESAVAVFERRDIPRTIALVQSAFEHTEELAPDSFGALVSLVFNRGAAMGSPDDDPDRRLEMRQIRDAMAARRFTAVPGLILAMRRLWPDSTGVGGLRARRAAEADLFWRGLGAAVKTPVSIISTSEEVKKIDIPIAATETPGELAADALMDQFNKGA